MVLSESLGLVPPPAQDRATFEVYGRGGALELPGCPVLKSAHSLSKALPIADDSQTQLDLLRAQCLSLSSRLSEGYIWQRDAFNLALSSGGTDLTGACACLLGSLSFGENSEDEWFAVWLLQQITKRIEGTSARIRDEDGEFLLIEAAHALPRWLQPDTSAERVWLHQGVLHVIPKQHEVAGNVRKALDLVSDPHARTEAAEPIQQAVARKLAGYPERVRRNMHHARCLVPAAVAHILAQDPQLVAPAVEAFYARDAAGMKAAARMTHFQPEEWLESMVKFSRCLYAQLVQQQYEAPRQVPMPEQDDPKFPAASLGIKLTAGFEILCSELPSPMQRPAASAAVAGAPSQPDSHPDPQHGADLTAAIDQYQPAARSEPSSSSSSHDAFLQGRAHRAPEQPASAAESSTHQGPTDAEEGPRLRDSAHAAATGHQSGPARLDQDPGWSAFKSRLQSLGWFQGEMEGSKQYRQREQEAANMWQASEAHKRNLDALAAPVQRIQEILALPIDITRLQQEGAKGQEDGDAWMAEGPDEVDKELQAAQAELDASSKGKAARGTAQGEAAADQGFDPGEFARRMQAFVDKASGLEGAEVPDSSSAFDETRFCTELSQALGLQDLKGDLEDSSDEASSFFSDPPTDSDASSNDGTEAMQGDRSTDMAQAAEAAYSIPGVKARVQADMDRDVRVLRSQGSSAGINGSSGTDNTMSTIQQDQRAESGAASRSSMSQSKANSTSAHEAAGSLQAEFDQHGDQGESDAASSSDVATGTDSDDDEAFMEEYDAAMQAELSSSNLPQSFSRAGASSAAAPSGPAAGQAAQGIDHAATGSQNRLDSKQESSAATAGQESLMPVDLDLNLVQNLLESYSSQQGLPGPASNIAGMLGLTLPDNTDRTG